MGMSCRLYPVLDNSFPFTEYHPITKRGLAKSLLSPPWKANKSEGISVKNKTPAISISYLTADVASPTPPTPEAGVCRYQKRY